MQARHDKAVPPEPYVKRYATQPKQGLQQQHIMFGDSLQGCQCCWVSVLQDCAP